MPSFLLRVVLVVRGVFILSIRTGSFCYRRGILALRELLSCEFASVTEEAILVI